MKIPSDDSFMISIFLGRTPKHLGEDHQSSRSASAQPLSARGTGASSACNRAGGSSRVPNSGYVPNSAVGASLDLEFGPIGLTPSMFSANSPMLQTPTFGALDDMVGGFFGDEPLSTRGRRYKAL